MTVDEVMEHVACGASDGYARVLADEVRRLREELEYDHGAANYCKAMQEYRTAILSLGIDFFRDDNGTVLDAVEMGSRLRGLFGEVQQEKDRYRRALNNIRTQISSGTPTDLVWRLADNALRGGEE